MNDSAAANRRIVIVGGGQAAGAALRKLRDLRFDGPVLLASDEAHAPYERPPLSKEYLRGAEHGVRRIAPGRRANEQLLLGCAVVDIDAQARTITCGDGAVLGYDALLLATGGRPRLLAVPGSDLGQVHHLRTAADASALRASLEHCKHTDRPLLVVGGSWIGLEVAAAAREAGVQVVLLERGDRLCMRTLPAADAQWLQEQHALHGVDIRLRTCLVRLHGDAVVRRAELSDGARLEVGAVVAGIGITPNDALARRCGALVGSGVVVDGRGRTSVPHVYAAGDVAEQACAWHGSAVRIETWDNANRQGEAAAIDMAAPGSAGGGTAASPPPWFWSDQYGANLQVLGAPLHGDTLLVDGVDGARLAIHLRGGAVVGAVGINRARDLRRLRKLLGAGAPLDRAALRHHGLVG